MYPTSEQEQQMLLHWAHARYVWKARGFFSATVPWTHEQHP
ncbi:hypothetical protein [Streptomyces violaceus]